MTHITTLELFAGAGGLASGLEKAGFFHLALNEFNADACATLRLNRPAWNIIEGDIHTISWEKFKNQIHLLAGGFPCQAFSHSGKRLGFEDTRGTLFYEFARSIQETKPLCFLAENVTGLLSHDKGNTINTILNAFSDLGYHVYPPLLLNANNYEVAQKRERIFIFGVQKQLQSYFHFNAPQSFPKLVLKDIFFPGQYYSSPLADFTGAQYSARRKEYFQYVPEGGNWRNLDIEQQKAYMGNMFYAKGGRTGVLKRLSYNEPAVTLLTSPAQTQTERCHPTELRPLSIREYARIQSFPDEWQFKGSIASQYRQIGNAVAVNLAWHLGEDIMAQIKNYLKNYT